MYVFISETGDFRQLRLQLRSEFWLLLQFLPFAKAGSGAGSGRSQQLQFWLWLHIRGANILQNIFFYYFHYNSKQFICVYVCIYIKRYYLSLIQFVL